MKILALLSILILCGCSNRDVLAIHPLMTSEVPLSQTPLAAVENTILATPAKLPVSSKTPKINIVVTVKNDNVYFRSCASTSCSGLPLPGGTKLIYKGDPCIVENGISWAKLWNGYQSGWMSATWISENVCNGIQ